MSDQLFETLVEFKVYRRGYDDAVASTKKSNVIGKLDQNSFGIQIHPDDLPYMNASGVLSKIK
jgi:hypothetical protein